MSVPSDCVVINLELCTKNIDKDTHSHLSLKPDCVILSSGEKHVFFFFHFTMPGN